MSVQFQLHIPDPEDVPKFGGPLLIGTDFRGMTATQARTAIAVFEKTIERLRQVVEFEEEHHEGGRGNPDVFRVS